MAGKGKVVPRFRQPTTDGLPELHCDYCFLSTEGSPVATVLVAKEKNTRMTLATVFPMTGASVELPVRRILAFLKELGLEGADIVLKLDQENSTVAP